jgi:hypothetical protein
MHDNDDELFVVLEGELLVDLETNRTALGTETGFRAALWRLAPGAPRRIARSSMIENRRSEAYGRLNPVSLTHHQSFRCVS